MAPNSMYLSFPVLLGDAGAEGHVIILNSKDIGFEPIVQYVNGSCQAVVTRQSHSTLWLTTAG